MLASSLNAAMVYQAGFGSDPVGALNSGDLASGATVVGTGSSIVNVGTVPTFCGPVNMGQAIDLEDNSWLDTNVHLENDLGIDANTDYTMVAWINFPSLGGDRFVFGAESGNVLHLGTRGTNYHSGHWGDDIGVGNAMSSIGNWQYVVWTNDGSTGIQEIFVDGTSVISGGGPAAPNQNFPDLLIGGTRSDPGRDFIGQIAGVAVYDEVLSPADQKIQAILIVPEPSRAILVMLALGSLLVMRRRR